MRKRTPAEHTTPHPPSRPAVPSWLVLVRFYACQVLGVFNPRMAAQLLRHDFVQGPEQPPAVPEGVWAAFPAFGQVVRAVAPGTVIAVRDGCRDRARLAVLAQPTVLDEK